MLTEDDCCIRKRAQNREEEATNNPRSENFQQNLTPIRQQLGTQEHQVTVDKNEENISQDGGRAWQKSVRLCAGIRREQAIEIKKLWLVKTVDSVGDIIGRRVACNKYWPAPAGGGQCKEEDGQTKACNFFHCFQLCSVKSFFG